MYKNKIVQWVTESQRIMSSSSADFIFTISLLRTEAYYFINCHLFIYWLMNNLMFPLIKSTIIERKGIQEGQSSPGCGSTNASLTYSILEAMR